MVVGGGGAMLPSYDDDDLDHLDDQDNLQYDLPTTATTVATTTAATITTTSAGALPGASPLVITGDHGRKQPTTLKRSHHLSGGGGHNHQQVENTTFIYMMTILSAMGGFLFGYDTGIVSGAMVFVKRSFHLNSLWQEVVVSITILGAWLLSFMAGSLSEGYGRKTVILWASMTFAVGSGAMGVAWSKYILMFGRLIVGMAIGLSSSVIPLYIAEVAPTKLRGSLVTLNTCFITFGQLSAAITAGAFSYDQENGWRWMLGLAALPALIQFVGFIFMPESPRWLIRQKRQDEALGALKMIRGKRSPHVLREFERMRLNQLEFVAQEERRRQQKRNIIVAIMRKTATRRALIVGCLLMAAQQLAGINTVMYYTATIIEMSGVQSTAIAVWLAVPTAAVFVIFSFCGYLVADRLGRRTLTLGSLMGVIISLIVLGTGFHLTSMKGAVVTHHNMSGPEVCFSKRDCASCVADPRCGFCYDAHNLAIASCLERQADDAGRATGGECAMGDASANFIFATHICPSMNQGIGLNTWLVLAGLVMYLAFFAPGMSGMPWTINSEIYPMWARSFCYSIATSVHWLFNMLISFTFITLTELITRHGVFYLYAIVSSLCWLALFWMLPETRGRSLEDISSLFARSTQRHADNQDMMEPEQKSAQQRQQQQQQQQQQACHDNLAFSHTAASRLHHLDRARSFKLEGPLAKAASLALSQPDLQRGAHHAHAHYHSPPANPPPPLPPQLQQQQQTTLFPGLQQQQQPSGRRKYSDGGGGGGGGGGAR